MNNLHLNALFDEELKEPEYQVRGEVIDEADSEDEYSEVYYSARSQAKSESV
jgi:hypothetical protein